MLSIFKKGSGSFKKCFFETRRNREYFVFVFKFSDNLFALNQFISEKRSFTTFMPEINKLVPSTNMTEFSFPEHLKRSFT